MRSHAELTESGKHTPAQPSPTQTQAQDWSGWERWLKGHLNNELQGLHRALGQLLAEERDRLERKTSALELRLAKLTGAIDVLRGAQPPPPAKFPTIKAWKDSDSIHYEGDIVAFAGGTYQAQRDTAYAPLSRDWLCLAKAGVGFSVRSTYNCNEKYKHLDVVMLNGSSFVALKDNPGACPDSGDWQLLASRGSRGHRGGTGERGLMGMRGSPGAAAPTIQSWLLDRTRRASVPFIRMRM